MELNQFCRSLSELTYLNQTQKALALLWFHDEKEIDISMTAGQLSKIMLESGLGNPNSTQLKENIRKTKLVLNSAKGFKLKDLSRPTIREWVEQILGDIEPEVDQDLGFLPKGVWTGTRSYIEKVCEQMNGCFQFHFYDAASVMLRRLVETLLIESYEHLKREDEIKGSDGKYMMLNHLITKATDSTGLKLSRDSDHTLGEVKKLGDRSAHNRRYTAVRADLEKVQSGIRVLVDDLIGEQIYVKSPHHPHRTKQPAEHSFGGLFSFSQEADLHQRIEFVFVVGGRRCLRVIKRCGARGESVRIRRRECARRPIHPPRAEC